MVVFHVAHESAFRYFDQFSPRRPNLCLINLITLKNHSGKSNHTTPAKKVHRHIVDAVGKADFNVSEENDINTVASVTNVENDLICLKNQMFTGHVNFSHCHFVETLEKVDASLGDFYEIVPFHIKWII